MESERVLVTGATGFVATHCIKVLLERGYRVRGSVRKLEGGDRVARVMREHVGSAEGLEFAQAELTSEAGWSRAVDGCQVVLHVASPLPMAPPKDPDDLIVPARDGALHVLKAAAAARVRRVVMTSSTAAVVYGHARDGSKTYDESTWSTLGPEVGAYEKSKTIAERAAWDFVQSLPASEKLELVTLNPGLVLGPLLGPETSTSGEVVRKLLSRELPGVPDIGFACVDVRDVAEAHRLAMITPEAAGRRFILAIEHASLSDVAAILAKHFGPRGFRIPTRRVPGWVLRLVATWDRTAALAVQELGKRQDVSSQSARDVLGWQPRGLETMVVDMAESMIRYGVVAPKAKRAATHPGRALAP